MLYENAVIEVQYINAALEVLYVQCCRRFAVGNTMGYILLNKYTLLDGIQSST